MESLTYSGMPPLRHQQLSVLQTGDSPTRASLLVFIAGSLSIPGRTSGDIGDHSGPVTMENFTENGKPRKRFFRKRGDLDVNMTEKSVILPDYNSDEKKKTNKQTKQQ
ncbi:uncharacterized protein SOCG_00829 [Schizosaccharomyces octosporus yFS286]|uniref:Uncharacterized protein n=1 Tax=Schizosaccharomyces octosporus (strain yFS286) TaxID=483514 RepID=S9Q040_SCHOY|nr:uncharacterized protein SOCG_00829 [Schizosaccharomyces octosporus yFS286]EPX73073.1 hypothetical protein SOCG_00829 [Schizosaccharomyces octosporus yFS286]